MRRIRYWRPTTLGGYITELILVLIVLGILIAGVVGSIR